VLIVRVVQVFYLTVFFFDRGPRCILFLCLNDFCIENERFRREQTSDQTLMFQMKSLSRGSGNVMIYLEQPFLTRLCLRRTRYFCVQNMRMRSVFVPIICFRTTCSLYTILCMTFFLRSYATYKQE